MTHPDTPTPSVLVSWIGATDLRAAGANDEPKRAGDGYGPLAAAVLARPFDRLVLLCNYSQEEGARYIAWLRAQTSAEVDLHAISLTSPTHLGEIYEATQGVIATLLEGTPNARLTYHLSPGTPSMAAIWIILAKTRHPAHLIETHRGALKDVRVPFQIAAEFLPELYARPDRQAEARSEARAPVGAAFKDILHNCAVMTRVLQRAGRVATRTVTVLIEGETGTGKELLARAIHEASPRREKPFVPVNCGAIPPALIDSELFGHVKGAFTGADQDRAGVFAEADGGTLFLDEVGELTLDAQVRLLRALQSRTIRPVGSTKERMIDVRVVAATHRDLLKRVAEGSFREDLFYRLAVANLTLPALRERREDLPLLVRGLMKKLEAESADDPDFRPRTLNPEAERRLYAHPWPGNVRELENTLQRMLLWAEGDVLTPRDVEDALQRRPGGDGDLLNRPLGDGIDLEGLIGELHRHYIGRAMAQSKTKKGAAELLGFNSPQVLTNKMKAFGWNDS